MSQVGLLGRIRHATRRSRRVLLPNARDLFLWFCYTLFALTSGTGQAAPQPWQPVGLSGGGGMFSPAISPVDPDLMILNCDMGAAYISADGGRHWRMIHHAQLKSDTRCRPGFHPSDANVIYASSRGQLRISRDRGKTFRPIGNLKKGLAGEIAIHPSAPDSMLLGTRDGHCWLSRDAGATWSVCSGPDGPVLGFHFDTTAAGEVMFAATEQGIWRSDDQGRTWRRKTHGLPSEALREFAGGSDAQRDLTMLYCTTASQIANGRLTGGVYRSDDRGETCEKISASQAFLYTKDLTVHPQRSHEILVGVCDANWEDKSGGLYRTTDGGKHWQRIGRQGRQTFGGYFHPQRKGWIYMTLTEGAPGAGLWLSRDNGRSWRSFDDLPFANIQRVQFGRSDDQQIDVTTFGGSVWRGPAAP